MERWSGRVALITGAASGIGMGVSVALVDSGMNVIGCDISKENLQAVEDTLKGKKGEFIPYKCDVTNDDEVVSMFRFISDKYGAADVCINCAGGIYIKSMIEGTADGWRKLMNLNVISYCHIAKLAVHAMLKKGIDDGHIINISSMSGHKIYSEIMPDYCFYSATKSAVNALTEGLRQELKGLNSNIRVSALSPGVVRTNIAKGVQINEKLMEKLNRFGLMEVSDVAKCIVFMLSLPHNVEVNDMLVASVEQKAF